MNQPSRTVSTSPHIHANSGTAPIMWSVSAALAPAALWGVYVFGWRALLVLLISITSAVLVEYLLCRIDGKNTIADGSAFLTGLLVGMNMPPAIPLFIPVVASAFAIFVVKWSFGGLGANWMNPALGGRVFVFFSFTSAMSTFSTPRTLVDALPLSVSGASKVADAVSSATPLGLIKTAVGSGSGAGLETWRILAQEGYPATRFAQGISDALGKAVSPYTIDSFFGNVAGCIGEVSTILLLVGAIYLLCKKIITWQIPVSYLGSFALFVWVFGGIRSGLGLFHGEALSALVSGGLILGAFFMATDMVTSPTTGKGQIIFGIGCGFFTFLFRYFGSLPEAVSLAILLMNIVNPTIERYVLPKRFGAIKPQKEAKS